MQILRLLAKSFFQLFAGTINKCLANKISKAAFRRARRSGTPLYFLFSVLLITSLKLKATGRLDKLTEILPSKEENQLTFYKAHYGEYVRPASEAARQWFFTIRIITKIRKKLRKRNQEQKRRNKKIKRKAKLQMRQKKHSSGWRKPNKVVAAEPWAAVYSQKQWKSDRRQKYYSSRGHRKQ